jgi:hypothetical protein
VGPQQFCDLAHGKATRYVRSVYIQWLEDYHVCIYKSCLILRGCLPPTSTEQHQSRGAPRECGVKNEGAAVWRAPLLQPRMRLVGAAPSAANAFGGHGELLILDLIF